MHFFPLLALTPTLLAASIPSIQSLDFSKYGITPRAADPSLTGYLGAFFLRNAPSVYFYLSNGNNALSMEPLNNGVAVINATLGTKGVRDPSIVVSADGSKYYIIGTDLDIAKTTWDAAARTGSRKIFVWESTDLVTWTDERLIELEDDTAGMVWAPGAIWDPASSSFIVHWASKFYATTDPQHTGPASANRIRYAYTTDFVTFTAPKDYINYEPVAIIDLEFLSLGNNSFARFMKNETSQDVFTEISTTGLFGTWTRPGGPDAIIQSRVEGPAPYWDNEVPGKAYLLIDFYGGNGYAPYESTNVESGIWTASDAPAWPKLLRHGFVLPINAKQVEALAAGWN